MLWMVRQMMVASLRVRGEKSGVEEEGGGARAGTSGTDVNASRLFRLRIWGPKGMVHFYVITCYALDGALDDGSFFAAFCAFNF